MAGVKGRSGPPGNQNNFKHGLAAIQKRREERIPTEHEESVRQQILDGLIADKGGDEQISTATRILAEVIASDASWLMVFNGAIDHIIQNNPKAKVNPPGLHFGSIMKLMNVSRYRLYPPMRAASKTSDTPGVHPRRGPGSTDVALQSMAMAD